MKIAFVLAAFSILVTLVAIADTPKNPIEAGAVTWLRDYEKATAQSAETGKPIFLLFQEIPGCAGCQQFGREVLSDPQIVEAIESEFVPLLVPNNKGGKDAEMLRKFNEQMAFGTNGCVEGATICCFEGRRGSFRRREGFGCEC